MDEQNKPVETRGGEKIDWENARPGQPLPELPEPEAGQTYDEISEIDT